MCVPGCQEAVWEAVSLRRFFKGAIAASVATAAAPQIASAAPARNFTSPIDLTHTMSAEFPTFFGVPGIEMEKKFDLKKDGFNLYWWRIVEHAGTHLDAPIHFSEAGASVEKISADTLVVPLAVVDVAAKAAHNPDYLLTVEDLADWEKGFEGGRVIEGVYSLDGDTLTLCFPDGSLSEVGERKNRPTALGSKEGSDDCVWKCAAHVERNHGQSVVPQRLDHQRRNE